MDEVEAYGEGPNDDNDKGESDGERPNEEPGKLNEEYGDVEEVEYGEMNGEGCILASIGYNDEGGALGYSEGGGELPPFPTKFSIKSLTVSRPPNSKYAFTRSRAFLASEFTAHEFTGEFTESIKALIPLRELPP